jgi:CheY-like chemotaxis protein
MAKIMIVDDERDIRVLVREMLEREGYEVSEAGTGEECLKKLKDEKPDLILLDIMMPILDGWEVSKRIKEDEETKDIAVVMFTVRTSEESRSKSLHYAKADAHIDKLFDREELLAVIKKYLRMSK